MTQEALEVRDRRAALEEVDGERVAEGVETEALLPFEARAPSRLRAAT